MEVLQTWDYNLFRLFPENRQVTGQHVRDLIKDPTFPLSYMMHPIVINEEMFIVDGQHRFYACRRLNLPIYYITQIGASSKDIIPCQNSKRWSIDDYIRYYSKKGDKNYLWFLEFRERYAITIFQARLIVRSFIEEKSSKSVDIFKLGKLVVKDESKFFIEDFASTFVNMMKTLISAHGKSNVFHLWNESYIRAFTKIYKEDIKKYEKVIQRLPQYFQYLPMTLKSESCLDHIDKAISKRPRVG